MKRWKRTRSGCLNCRGKKRKCDEGKPECLRCQRRHERCQWGMRVAFRSENALTLPTPSAAQRARGFEIIDLTPDVVRDCRRPLADTVPATRGREHEEGDPGPLTGGPLDVSQQPSPDFYFDPNLAHSPSASAVAPPLSTPKDGSTSTTAHPWLQQVLQPPLPPISVENAATPSLPQHLSAYWDPVYSSSPPDARHEDGIFLPGSEYLELHATLRNRLILEGRSSTPAQKGDSERPSRRPTDSVTAGISKREEYVLWKNWLDEIAPWLDKFDNHLHFQHTLPILAQSHDHLRYSMLALSARQLERKNSSLPIERSLLLYHQAIHLLLPHIPTRSTAVIASCVVLCVLEMLSCAPMAWERHLDGCAGLIQAVGINGTIGGVEQALFWCFVRMDVCGGLISSSRTLIPTSRWLPGVDLDADVGQLRATSAFDTYANHVVYLCAQVLDLLAPLHLLGRATITRSEANDYRFPDKWLKLWHFVDDWHSRRPEEMKHVVHIPSSPMDPFPTVLFSNAAAVSGNQLYHTAAILMLQTKPAHLRLDPKPRSALWHARQICGISMSNDHHGAWTNSIQPLWVAGQWMSHPSEHRAILELLERIEKESGWATKWRAEDLKEFWGDLDSDGQNS